VVVADDRVAVGGGDLDQHRVALALDNATKARTYIYSIDLTPRAQGKAAPGPEAIMRPTPPHSL
jgi:hypothetical protein